MAQALWLTSDERRRWVRTAPGRGAGEPDLRVTGERFQEVRGFGGCFNELGARALAAMDPRARARLLDELFLGCDFTWCRVPIGSSDFGLEWYSHDEHDGDYAMRRFSIERDRRILLPYVKEGLKRQPGMTLFASPWSPPVWMKRPKAYNFGRLRREDRVFRAYALYFLKFVEAYRREGVTIRQIHPQNEPVADQKFPSCLWSGPELRDFIRDWLGPLFARRSPRTEIWHGTLNVDDYDQYVLAVLSDPGARRFIRGIGLQWWGKAIVQQVAAAWPGVPVAQTESECGDGRNTWDYALYVFNLLRHYLANGVVAYTYWNMILPDGGESTWGWKQNSMVCVNLKTGRATLNPEFHVMRHFSAFVHPGAVRLGLEGPWAGNASAFANPDGTTAVVLNNPLPARRRVVVEAGGGAWALALPPRAISSLRTP